MQAPANNSYLPTPYESALISTLSYLNPLDLIPPKKSDDVDKSYNAYMYLKDKGWRLEPKNIIHENDYFGYIWINDETHQIVISHRGSQNATSWITDAESVVQSKVGEFVTSAINTLSHPTVLEYRKKGYRLSSAGHSLGGFLAQILVFWSKRQEFLETYYPEMSAHVFDSPGICEFLEERNSNIKSEENKIKASSLNIHNFCATPTLVSTYGTQTGTIWHLPDAGKDAFSFVTDHRMGQILKGFDPVTGQPKDFRQMADWPQADYSHYEGLISTVEHLAGEGIKAPFTFLNFLYKKFIKRNPSDTWYDQIFRKDGQVEIFLRQSSYRPDKLQLEEKISLALKAHYIFKSPKESMTKISLVHFHPAIQTFLSDLFAARKFGLDKLGLEAKLRNYYGPVGFELLSKFSLSIQGDKVEVILPDDYQGNIFTFQNDLHNLFRNKEILSIRKLYGERVSEMDIEIKNLGDKQSVFAKELQDKLKALEANIEKVKNESEIYLHCAVSKTAGANAYVLLSKSYSLQRAKEDLEKAKPGFRNFIECAIADHVHANAAIIPPDISDDQMEFMKRAGFFPQSGENSSNTVPSISSGSVPPPDTNVRKEGGPTVRIVKK